MNNYQDVYSRYHHKPVTVSNPYPSGNGWLYTAYAAKLGMSVDRIKLLECYKLSYNETPVPHLVRSPGYAGSPISRDEILGITYLFGERRVDFTPGWNFSPYPIPKFNPLKLAQQLWELRPIVETTYRDTISPIKKYSLKWKHRNYFWKNGLDQIYRFGFSVPLQDRHFILKTWGKFQWYNPAHVFYAAVAKIDSKLGKESGIRWLKYNTGTASIMAEEFPADHPIHVEANK